jgi:FKBP-type peptidyl-prolyl cis-trans isomerase 2
LAFNDGDFVKVDYSAWRAADSKLIYTTMRKVAEDNKEVDKDARYVPQLIVIGKGNAIKGVEEAVRGMNVSETKKVELAPKDAFGEKDSSLVKVMPLSDFKKREIDPYPGMQLDIDGAVAIVKSVSSGRVIVDANHPLAGEKMVYEIRIIEKVDKDEDRIRALADTYGVSADSVAVSNGNARVLFGEKVEKDSKYLVNKSDFVNAVLRYMDKISKVTVEEDYVRKKAEEKGS